MWPEIVEKGWGREIIFANDHGYCGKVLEFDRKLARTSMHFHVAKHETFYVQKGKFHVETMDKKTGASHRVAVGHKDCMEIPPGMTHRIICQSDGGGSIIEVSTHDDPEDSYRVAPGDSQND